ncbi:uncharacterized protein [Pseudorasbora parva]|uniref:uncharacterized protein n=1 Tax=Pseudorasbora parva TaxID=51549 RepID=UPI00351E8F88
MAGPAKRSKTDVQEEDCVSGYIHAVSTVKVGVRTGGHYFNAVIQVSREEYRHVVVFAVEKRSSFCQAEKNRSAVKLKNIRRRVSAGGGEFDVQCGKSTEMVVVKNIGFAFKEAPQNSKRTVAELKAMAGRQQVGLIEVKVRHIDLATEMVEIRGANVETQTCHVEDASGRIKLQLWAGQIGMVLVDHSYQIRNLCTREYLGDLFLTTTRSTEIVEVKEVAGASSFEEFKVAEEDVSILTGTISRAEISVSKRCTKCQTWQVEFNSTMQFHRCERCRFLQKSSNYQCTAKGRVVLLLNEGDEMDLTVSNSVIRRYLQKENMLHLLIEGQNVEEHLLSGEAWQVKIQREVVVTIDKVAGLALGTSDARDKAVDEEVAGAMQALEREAM